MSDEKKLALVVDDDEDYRLQLRRHLEVEGFEVVALEGEKEAEEFLQSKRPDLALVDLMMEHMDGGFSLAYKLKKMDPPVPVIMVTGVTSETGLTFETGADEGGRWIKADAILSKPIRAEQLKREIDRVMNR